MTHSMILICVYINLFYFLLYSYSNLEIHFLVFMFFSLFFPSTSSPFLLYMSHPLEKSGLIIFIIFFHFNLYIIYILFRHYFLVQYSPQLDHFFYSCLHDFNHVWLIFGERGMSMRR